MKWSVRLGDLFDVLPTLEAESVSACVTDPPYGIGFMGREWDTFAPGEAERRIVPNRARESDNPNLRGRTRGPASSPSAVEYNRSLEGQRAFQAWTESWARDVYRVLKPGAHLLVSGAPRSFHRAASGLEDAGLELRDCLAWLFGQGFPKSHNVSKAIDREAGAELIIGSKPDRWTGKGTALNFATDRPQADAKVTAPATAEAETWAGWGTALKPAWEPILVARKPLAGTVAANVLEHGTGAINIDGCRIPDVRPDGGDRFGRWPANCALDEEAAALLDAQTGELASGSSAGFDGPRTESVALGTFARNRITPGTARGDVGGASRFFYVPKPDGAERGQGVDRNGHPTVKPIELMRWLIRLVTPPGGLVLDPFAGSGTTGMACAYEGLDFLGIEREPEFRELARRRIASCVPLLSEEIEP